jgi:hypothetical protein
MLSLSVHAGVPEAIVRELLAIGRVNLLCISALMACLIIGRLVGPRGKRLLLGLAFLTFLVSQGRSLLDTYINSDLYKHRKIMSLSDLLVVENAPASRWFSGRDVLPLLVADYMPRAKVFLYDDNLYSKELLGWSGHNPDSTFVVGGYRSTMDGAFKVACLSRSHILYKGRASLAKVPLYVATPLEVYEKEQKVFLMKDELIDYLIPGSWRASQDE